MRLFVAVDPTAEVTAHLLSGLPTLPRVRRTDPQTWHITLAFCGEVDASTAEALGAGLSRVAADLGPVPVALRGSGVFGQALWVGVDGELEPLAEAVGGAVREAGIETEDRPFRPHLTVGRTTDRAGAKSWVREMSGYVGPEWVADELRLVRSHLGGGPVRHETVQTRHLGR